MSPEATRWACSDWPRVLNPAEGYFPPAVPLRRIGRVLQVALSDNFERQPGLEAGLRSIATDFEVFDWQAVEAKEGFEAPARRVLKAVERFRPDYVWMQLQRKCSITGAVVDEMHRLFPGMVVTDWDGDETHEPWDPRGEYFLDVGRAVDASLKTNTTHQWEYLRRGVKRPGYLAIGTDDRWGRRARGAGETGKVVFLASNYPKVKIYQSRIAMVSILERALGDAFRVYGNGWSGPCARQKVVQTEESDIYGSCAAAIVMSNHNNLGRYHSDRLLRAMRSGALCLVERVPDLEGMGLHDGSNCFVWETYQELRALVRQVLKTPWSERFEEMRGRAAALIDVHHTWAARMPELLAIIDAVRS